MPNLFFDAELTTIYAKNRAVMLKILHYPPQMYFKN